VLYPPSVSRNLSGVYNCSSRKGSVVQGKAGRISKDPRRTEGD